MKLRLIFLWLLLILGACSCSSSPESVNTAPQNADDLIVSAAISLRNAFGEIGDLYQSKTSRSVRFNFGSSGALQRQIETGAPVDIFASAGEKQMKELSRKNLIDLPSRRNFARNKLVLIAPNDSKLEIADFADLSKREVQKIAVGNPQTVPAGLYTDQLFERINLKNDLQSKLVLTEDVRQVLDYVVRGEVDAGIVYATDSQSSREKVRVVTVAPENSHQPILYPIAIIRDSKQPQKAQDFIDFVLGADGQIILRKYGFMSAAEK